MIPRRNIQSLSVKLDVPDQTIEKDYVLSWILIGIARSSLKDALLFKGGTALKKIFIKDYRFSEDLDFTLVKDLSSDEIKKELDVIFSDLLKLVNIKLILHNEEIRHKTYSFYINYSGPLEADISKRDIKVDITTDELCLFPSEERPLIKEYDEYSDLDYEKKISVYDIREVFVEKLCCLLAPARNEPRDVYDMWFLFDYLDDAHIEVLFESFKEKAEFKGSDHRKLENAIKKKEKQYEKSWEERLKDQINELPEFNRVYRELKRKLKQKGYF